MTYRYKGIQHTDAGAVVTRTGPAPGSSERSDGWAYDTSGRAFIVTSGTTAYRWQGRSFTADGSLLTTTGAATAYTHEGQKFDSRGFCSQSTLRVP